MALVTRLPVAVRSRDFSLGESDVEQPKTAKQSGAANRPKNTKSGSSSVAVTAVAFVAAVAVAAIGAWTYLQVTELKQTVAALESTVQASEQRVAMLTEKVDGFQSTASALPAAAQAQLEAQARAFEEQIINSGTSVLKSTIALAKKEMLAFGGSGYRFNMVEFDRRSCVAGGTFSGELSDGSRLDEEFEPNSMVEVLESRGDVRGIPFYRVTVNGSELASGGGAASFRHGSMRIACK